MNDIKVKWVSIPCSSDMKQTNVPDNPHSVPDLGSNTIWIPSNTLSVCFSLLGVPDERGLHGWDVSIGYIATGKLSQAFVLVCEPRSAVSWLRVGGIEQLY